MASMHRRERALRVPFVLTLAALAAAPVACGGDAEGGSGSAGGSGGTSGGTGGTSGSGTGGSGSGGVGGNPPMPDGGGSGGAGGAPSSDCPPQLPDVGQQCSVEVLQQTVCEYDVPCQSGSVKLGFRCTGDSTYAEWHVEPSQCGEQYDSCPGTQLYCDGTWWSPDGTNPPSPCPATRPAWGTECSTSSMGGVHASCGYRCGGTSTAWTIGTCIQQEVADAGVPPVGQWYWDSACGEGG